MSMVMEAAMAAWERGLSSVPDKSVCSSHIDDYAVRLFIKRNGEMGTCDYCKKSRLVIDLDMLMEFLTDALMHFFTDPANFMSYVSAEGGYLGDFDGPLEQLEGLGLTVEDEGLYEDMVNSFDHTSAWADEGSAASDFKYEGWLQFRHLVKHQSRYLFSPRKEMRLGDKAISAESFLKELAGDIKRQRMITVIKAGTPIYRCRQHASKNEVKYPRDICSPPIEHATFPNRMSSAGISMFYGALDVRTAKLETLNRLDSSKVYYTIATFFPKIDLKLIDLSKIPYVSPFDQENWDLYDKVEFLFKFLDDFAKPVCHDGTEHIEYVPTQVITEYFRYKFYTSDKKPIDGIIYPSSKDRGRNACVLFMDHYQSLDLLQCDEKFKVKKLTVK
ncbi:HEPN-associated N-terminal domain-containing protein [Pedobacter nanyangensis]|uniref:HEPN-associated N-terminal domain-containing protein n=1 Tax=Pedobacter nanyangensis TaxID=1562389 RepID=UPI000DE35AAE|nr:HEPN-associated N-terminal domain-containing protein [Pedobacter nanyangensis]